VMLRILQFQETKGETLRDMLRNNGILCEQVRPRVGFPNDRGIDLSCVVWRYYRPASGTPIWITELDLYIPPDVVVTRSWLTNAAPSLDQVETIITTNAQVGAVIR